MYVAYTTVGIVILMYVIHIIHEIDIFIERKKNIISENCHYMIPIGEIKIHWIQGISPIQYYNIQQCFYKHLPNSKFCINHLIKEK